jgi:two-component system NtrC family sensor kinase
LTRNEFKSQIEIERDFCEPLAEVWAQSSALSQVFVNILLNATQAIGLRPGKIVISMHQHAERIVITITDSGCGISEQHLQHIFEPFFTTKDIGKGTGLGLSICQNIIAQHGSALTAQPTSALGGAEFKFSLPLAGSK